MKILCRYSLGFALFLALFGRSQGVALGGDCSSDTCADTTNHVCENDGGTHFCKVKADGTATDCSSSNSNCPASATCATSICNCDAGWIHDGNGLCTVQNAVCAAGGTACGDTTNFVCDTSSNTCKVKADGSKTDCASTTANCPAHATCATTVCNCDAGWIDDGTGICGVALGGDCSSSTCADSTNHVCENDGAGSQLCKVKADGVKTDCAGSNANCPNHATCVTTVCNCDAGWIDDGTGICGVALGGDCSSSVCADSTNHVCENDGAGSQLCKVKADGTATDCMSTDSFCPANATCSTTTCSCDSGYTEDAGLCVSGGLKLTASGLGVYLFILLISFLY